VSLAGDMVTYTPPGRRKQCHRLLCLRGHDGKGGSGRGCGRGANRQLRCGNSGRAGVFRARPSISIFRSTNAAHGKPLLSARRRSPELRSWFRPPAVFPLPNFRCRDTIGLSLRAFFTGLAKRGFHGRGSHRRARRPGEALIPAASHVLGKRPLQVQQLGVTVPRTIRRDPSQAQEWCASSTAATGCSSSPTSWARRLDIRQRACSSPARSKACRGRSLPMLIRRSPMRRSARRGGREGDERRAGRRGPPDFGRLQCREPKLKSSTSWTARARRRQAHAARGEFRRRGVAVHNGRRVNA